MLSVVVGVLYLYLYVSGIVYVLLDQQPVISKA